MRLLKSFRQIPQNMWILAATTLINRSGSMVVPYLVLYLTKGVGIPLSQASLIVAAYGLGSMVASPFSGRLCDKFGAVNVMKYSLLFTAILLVLFPFFNNYYVILVMAAVLSAVNEAFRPANLTLIADIVPHEQRKTAYAVNRLAINLGFSIGPVIGGFIFAVDPHFIFYIDGLGHFAAWLYLAYHAKKFETGEHYNVRSGEGTPEKKKFQPAFRDHRYMLYLIAMFPVTLVFFQHFAMMPVYITKDLAMSEKMLGILFLVNTIIIIIVEVPLNEYLSHWSDIKSIAVGSVLTGIGFGMMAISHDFALLILTIVIWTFGEMIFFPASTNFIAQISEGKNTGEYMGYYQVLFNISFTTAAPLGTLIYEGLGAQMLWLSTFFMAMITVGLMYFLRDMDKKKAVSAGT